MKCPYCKKPLIAYNRRWNGYCICPSCQKTIEVDFDFTVLEDGDEWDHITLMKKEEQDFGSDLFECELDNDI